VAVDGADEGEGVGEGKGKHSRKRKPIFRIQGEEAPWWVMDGVFGDKEEAERRLWVIFPVDMESFYRPRIENWNQRRPEFG